MSTAECLDSEAAKLTAHLPDDFSRKVFAATWVASRDETSPLRLTFFSVGVREMIEHLLHRWAPDDKVAACSWFIGERKTPTRRQRGKYAVQGGLSDAFLRSIKLDLERLYGSLPKQMDGLSKYVHIREATLPRSVGEVDAQISEALSFLTALFEGIRDCRAKVAAALEAAIHEETVMALVTENLDDINVLSSSHSVEMVDVEAITVSGIEHDVIHFHVRGTISVEFYWGSGEDGATKDEDLPFTATMWSFVDNLDSFEDVEVFVDASEWLSRFEPDADDY